VGLISQYLSLLTIVYQKRGIRRKWHSG